MEVEGDAEPELDESEDGGSCGKESILLGVGGLESRLTRVEECKRFEQQ